MTDVLGVVRQWVAAAEVVHRDGPRPGEVVVDLPGEHKLTTSVSLLCGEHSLSAAAFVMRRPDENVEGVQRWMLRRNARLPGIAFAVDGEGDVFLVGRLPAAAVDAETLDQLMGAMLEVADGSFDELLGLGFASAIRAEWAWRRDRGESTRNLAAFTHLLQE